MWCYTSLIPVPGEAEADGFLWVLGQPGLYRESQSIWGHRVRLCPKKKKRKKENIARELMKQDFIIFILKYTKG